MFNGRSGLFWPLLTLAILQCFLSEARPATPASNGTISDDGSNPHIYCEKTQWYHVCWFFFSNYLLHALSVRSLPGENNYSTTVFKLCCLLVPYTGVRRGLCLVSRASSLAKDDLQAAARAGALVMVTRGKDWRPVDGDTISGCRIQGAEADSRPQSSQEWEKSRDINRTTEEVDHVSYRGPTLQIKDTYQPAPPSSYATRLYRTLVQTHFFRSSSPSSCLVDHENIKLHGYCELAPGYALAYVPQQVKIFARRSSTENQTSKPQTRVSSTHGIPRILFSLIQTVSGGYSLFKARGSQIDRYGYAAFGLTVIPYMVVSVINFLGSMLTSEYETCYVVHSAMMDEMVQRGGIVDGAVGTLEEYGSGNKETSESTEDGATTMRFSCNKDQISCRSVQTGSCITICHQQAFHTPPKASILARIHRNVYWQTELHWWMIFRRKKCSAPSTGPMITIPAHHALTPMQEPRYQTALDSITLILLLVALAAPWLIIGILSGFHANQSTSTQRNMVFIWLIAGQLQGYVAVDVERLTGRRKAMIGLLVTFVRYGSNCLCGLVIVAQEMIEFGTCEAL